MKVFLKTILMLTLVITLAACGGNGNEPVADPVPGPEVIDNDNGNVDENINMDGLFADDNWSMEIADGWEVMELGGMLFLMATDTEGSNINVVTESTHGMNIDEYLDATFEALDMFIPDFELITHEDITMSGEAGGFIAFTSGIAGVHTTYQFFTVIDGTAYIVTYSRMGEDPNLLDEVRSMLETFTIR